MSGTSYLAVAQWFTAAEQPPHLAAINPWEGVSDVYRDLVMRGGMPDTGFARQLQDGSFFGKSRKEDVSRRGRALPADERPVGEQDPSISSEITRAGLRRGQLLEHAAHRGNVPRLAANRLRGEVAAHPQQPGMARLLRRGEQGGPAPLLRPLPEGTRTTGGSRRPAFATRSSTSKAATRSASRPTSSRRSERRLDEVLPRRRLAHVLATAPPTERGETTYDVDANPDAVSFIMRFDQETVLVGYPKAHLWVEARGADDMDLFVLVQKLDAYGTPLQQFTVPNQGATRPRPHRSRSQHPALQGIRRAAARFDAPPRRGAVDRRRARPQLRQDREALARRDRRHRNRPVPDRPWRSTRANSSVSSSAAENILGTLMPAIREYVGANSGQHVIHTGAEPRLLSATPHQDIVTAEFGAIGFVFV